MEVSILMALYSLILKNSDILLENLFISIVSETDLIKVTNGFM